MIRISRLLICAALFGVALAQSVKEKAVMLPSPVRLTGVVMDSGGRPLSNVWINHTGVPIENAKTDSLGQFDIEARGPAIVFRGDGFQSKYWRVNGDRKLIIILSGPTPRVRECGTFFNCASLKGFMSAFCLPRIPGVHISKQSNDVDYGQRWFWVRTLSGKAGIQHAAGAMWGPGLPSDEDVWSARDYVETSYRDQEGFGIIDARGKNVDGKCWRILGHVFETASYRNVPAQDTALLDRVLDGVCVGSNRARP